MNSLIRVAADKKKAIITNNLQMIGTLMNSWKGLVYVDKKYISMMLKVDPKPEKQTDLWNMVAI